MTRSIFHFTRPGWAMVFAAGVLSLFGLATIYVTDTHYASGHDGPRNALRQAVYLLSAMIVGFGVIHLGYQRFARLSYVFFGLSVLALIPPVIARLMQDSFGGLIPPRNGAYRWIRLPGFQLQPSEFLKITYVLALAWYLRYRSNYRRFRGLLVPFAVSAVPFAFILLEPDLGTVLLLTPVLFVMLFLAGAKVWHLGLIGLLGVLSTPFAWDRLEPYQRLRVSGMLLQSESLRQAIIREPQRYSLLATKRQAQEWEAGSGYQLVHSKNAIGAGGWKGHGWGEGVYSRNTLLPDRHNDFIFSMIGHQWGLFGCLIVLICHVVLFLSGCAVVTSTMEPVGRLLAAGLLSLLSIQSIINVGMSVGLMPTTGMTLPFVSFGGSSMITSVLAIALLISVSRSRPYLLAVKPFEFQRSAPDRTNLTMSEELLPARAAGNARPVDHSVREAILR